MTAAVVDQARKHRKRQAEEIKKDRAAATVGIMNDMIEEIFEIPYQREEGKSQ